MFLQTKMFRVSWKAFVVPSIPWCLSTLDIYTHNTFTHHAHKSQLVFFDRVIEAFSFVWKNLLRGAIKTI